jgi:hypothetical protein
MTLRCYCERLLSPWKVPADQQRDVLGDKSANLFSSRGISPVPLEVATGVGSSACWDERGRLACMMDHWPMRDKSQGSVGRPIKCLSFPSHGHESSGAATASGVSR